jgi:hypothetical protein
MLKLWSVQTIEAWDILKNTGVLQGKEKLIDDESFLNAYKWMMNQMEQRLGKKPSENGFPMWAWYQWKDDKHRRPDLRFGGHAPKGEKQILIELEVPAELILLSDFSTWHHVLGYYYLPLNEIDANQFEKELELVNLDYYKMNPLPGIYDDKMMKSWEMIFDLDYYDEYINYPKSEKMIQATMWEIKLEWVKSVKEFIGRG